MRDDDTPDDLAARIGRAEAAGTIPKAEAEWRRAIGEPE